mmetsp:Transcript_14250/g.43045  ORF Transcript_14250/g.43045 Transcript_14250/m.43045 type:complete len:338 (-) Transcript_14250:1242-2255(-)
MTAEGFRTRPEPESPDRLLPADRLAAGCWGLAERPAAGLLRFAAALRSLVFPLSGCDARYAAACTAAAHAAAANFFACRSLACASAKAIARFSFAALSFSYIFSGLCFRRMSASASATTAAACATILAEARAAFSARLKGRPILRGIMAFSAFMSTPSKISGLPPSPRLAAAAFAVGRFSRCFRGRDLLAGDAFEADLRPRPEVEAVPPLARRAAAAEPLPAPVACPSLALVWLLAPESESPSSSSSEPLVPSAEDDSSSEPSWESLPLSSESSSWESVSSSLLSSSSLHTSPSGRNMDMFKRTASSRALHVHRVAFRPSGSQSVSAKLTASAQLNP